MRNCSIAHIFRTSLRALAALVLGLTVTLTPPAAAATPPTMTSHAENSPVPLAPHPVPSAEDPPLMRSPAPRAPTPSFIYRDAVPIYVLAQIVTASTQLAAVLFGALWVLSLYRLNRSSVPRLQLNLQAETRRIKDAWCLSASFEVHNIGSTMVSFREPLDPKGGPGGCAIILIPLAPRATPLTAMRTPVRQRRYIHDILKLYGLERHQSVEPGNCSSTCSLITLPGTTRLKSNCASRSNLSPGANGCCWLIGRTAFLPMSWSFVAPKMPSR